jgi:hypothetical protein
MTKPPIPPRRPRLGRDILCLSLAKLVALGLLYTLFFAPSHRVPIDPASHFGVATSPPPSQR